ncbi:MAG: SBBP repeat-containing protein [Ilumatobacteraceae bacterium]
MRPVMVQESVVAPYRVTVDSSGNVYVAGQGSNNVFRVSPGGGVTEIIDSTGDGAGTRCPTPMGWRWIRWERVCHRRHQQQRVSGVAGW